MRWTVQGLAGGPRRVNHASVGIGKFIYSFGGYCSGDNYKDICPIDVFCLNTTNYRWTALTKPNIDSNEADNWPFQRYGHTVVAHGPKIYLFGGRNDNHSCNRLYCFDTKKLKWSSPNVFGTIPSARDGHSACVIQDAMYIFGGYSENSFSYTPIVFRLNLNNYDWTLLECEGSPPIYRDFHTATAIDNKMFVFGGRSYNGNDFTQTELYCDRLFYLDLISLRWVQPEIQDPKPMSRRSHSALNLDGGLLIFGGYNSCKEIYMNDLWLLDSQQWTWRQLRPYGKGPEPRRRQSVCRVGSQIFLFGGVSPLKGIHVYFTQEQLELMSADMPKNLIDHNDTYVLDLKPSLRSLCMDFVVKNSHHYNLECLPQGIKYDIECMTKDNTISEHLKFKGLPLG